ncbi:glycosyltransferase [Paucilactobacillus hokkaidonensis JCM 18461]|uniref:Glycosyltransferase n=2 Tax=Paucilactobacillus hokkaidonensis TaxID=1193095 RepID=A0A0A1GS67_9LACO|nr:glycosyltransferase family 4 protein [Paucilactobacillus hokkaidonensis]KRO09344.1 hypothetical protein IV59_GL000682 [Paucilactobacillus hokkaidonensis]BAP84850.1 glycosyltransferase [Paucilactobacillus hokkaidonensis JCM 18461]
MKILYVTTVSSTVNAFLIPHIEQLVKDGHQVDIACASNQPLDPQLEKLACKWNAIDFSRSTLSTNHLRSYQQMRHLFKQEHYDVVHTHTPIASFIVRLASRHLPIKVIYTAHGFHFHSAASRKNQILFHSLEWLAAQWTDLLITINNEDHQNALKLPVRGQVGFTHGIGFRPELAKLPPDFDRQQWRQRYHLNEQDTVLVFAAELSKRKNQAQLIEALPHLDVNVKLLLLGDGPMKQQYETLAKQLNVAQRVIFAGYQSQITPFLALADIAVSSSKQEGLPVNIMEALAFNLPVIASNIRGHQDLIKPEINGFLYKTNDQLVEQINLLSNQPTPFKDADIQELLAQFSLEHVKQELAQLYRQVGITTEP